MGENTDPFAALQPQPQGPLPPSSHFATPAPPMPPPPPPMQQYPGAMPPPAGQQYPPQYGQQYPPPYSQAYPPQHGQQYPPQQGQAYPPQQGQPYPPQYGQQYPPQQGQAYPPPYGDGYAMQYGGYAVPKWRRSWGITMARWGIGCGVLFVVSMVIGLIAGSGQPTAEKAGEVAGVFFAGPLLYMPLIPWWLDHIIGRLGKAGAWAIHGAVSGLMALLWFAVLAAPTQPGEEPFLPDGVGAWWMMVVWAVGFVLSMVLADLLRRSYRPKQSA